jgi:hypothetical protein
MHHRELVYVHYTICIHGSSLKISADDLTITVLYVRTQPSDLMTKLDPILPRN